MSRVPTHLIAHYLRLGLKPTASRAEISAAYRAAALKHHPDRGGSAPDFAAITDSYNLLMRTSSTVSGHMYYRPASLRSFVDSRRDEPNPFNGIFTAIVLPSLIGVLVGVRLIYFGGDRTGLRAGGVSKFTPDELTAQQRPDHLDHLQQRRQRLTTTNSESMTQIRENETSTTTQPVPTKQQQHKGQ